MGRTAIAAYVASPHAGYLKLFRKYPEATLYILGQEYVNEFPSLTRHLPGNTPEDAQKMIKALGVLADVKILNPENLEEVKTYASIVMPDEGVSREYAKKYFPDNQISYDSTWKLRWDWEAVQKPNLAPEDIRISTDERDQMLLGKAIEESKKSPDWWRQVGALLARDGELVSVAYNTHNPSDQAAYVMGDPRSSFGPGERIEVTSSLHAEIGVLTEAARRGIAVEGCDMYVTTFPCPPCAYACANSGIKRLLYAEGYSLLAGADALKSRGIEIVRVDTKSPVN